VAGEKRSTERERERERLSLCYFFRHKSRTRRPVIEPRPVFEMPATDWLTLLYIYTHRERLVCLIIYSTCLFKVISSYEQHVKCLSLKSRLSNQTISAVNSSQNVSSYTHKLAVRKHTRGHYNWMSVNTHTHTHTHTHEDIISLFEFRIFPFLQLPHQSRVNTHM